jgi:dolichol-phosphate mannosyltransferase
MRGARIADYPTLKLVLNRLANFLIRILFLVRYNDVTNAFKLYRRSAIAGIQPLLSHHFDLTVELPLKCVVRGYRYTVLPNSWTGRKQGISKLRIKEMGSRYLFIILYCWLEKLLASNGYRDQQPPPIETSPRRGQEPGSSLNATVNLASQQSLEGTPPRCRING